MAFNIPIPIYSIPIPSHPHSQVFDLFPFPWDSRVGYSHSLPLKVKECIVLREIRLRTTGRHLSMGSHSVICHPTEVTAPPSPQPLPFR